MKRFFTALITFIELWREYGDDIIDLHNKLVAAIKDRKAKEAAEEEIAVTETYKTDISEIIK